jgi:alkanesulfonate monooxygenase SsuD/methylene tetrahydromethanopterin reductase-like flavin-dependent oxidoreductase (luciferase family)
MCELGAQVADSVLLNWLDPTYARQSAEQIREAALVAGRKPPRVYAYVRTAFGEGSRARLEREAATYSANQNYAAHFRRMGTTAVNAAISAETEAELAEKLIPWTDAVDEVIIRALPGEDAERATLTILNAAFVAFGNARPNY